MSAHYNSSLSRCLKLAVSRAASLLLQLLSAVQVLRPRSIFGSVALKGMSQSGARQSTIHFILLLRLTTNPTEGRGLVGP